MYLVYSSRNYCAFSWVLRVWTDFAARMLVGRAFESGVAVFLNAQPPKVARFVCGIASRVLTFVDPKLKVLADVASRSMVYLGARLECDE